jgi:hypothetical protein
MKRMLPALVVVGVTANLLPNNPAVRDLRRP